MGEIRTVDDHENVGCTLRDGFGGLADQPQQLRQLLYHRRQSHDRQLLDGEARDEPLARHLLAADTLESDGVAETLAQHLHQIGAEPVAGFFRRDQKDFSRDAGGWSRGHHAERPVRNRAAASAFSIIACGSTTSVLPATIATPASFAAAAPSTVCGPIVGRSKRRSWPLFGAFTRTPRPALARMRRSPRSRATRAS